MKFLFCITLVMGLVIPGTLWAKNLALELDGETAIEVPNSDSLNPKKAITIEAWMNMSKPVGECLAKDWGGQRDYIFPEIVQNGNGLRFVNTKNGNDGKGGFGKPNYIDVTKDLDLTPLSVDPEDKLAITWA